MVLKATTLLSSTKKILSFSFENAQYLNFMCTCMFHTNKREDKEK